MASSYKETQEITYYDVTPSPFTRKKTTTNTNAIPPKFEIYKFQNNKEASESTESNHSKENEKGSENNDKVVQDDSDSSDKKFDDRASILSVNSTKTNLNIEITIQEVVFRSPFAQFKSAWIPFITLFAFIVVFLISILVIYSNATTSIDTLD